MEAKLIALNYTYIEVEWIENLLFEIPTMPCPMAHIAIPCDSNLLLNCANMKIPTIK